MSSSAVRRCEQAIAPSATVSFPFSPRRRTLYLASVRHVDGRVVPLDTPDELTCANDARYGFGNQTSQLTRNCAVATEGIAPASNSDAVFTARSSGSIYDTRGQFAVTTSNALNHTETRDYDARYGGVTRLTGANASSPTDPNFTTRWTYDSFGRKKTETRADGVVIAWDYALCSTCASTIASYISYQITITQSGNANPSYIYFDQLDRQLLTSRRNFANNDWINDDHIVFDLNGRVAYRYLPYERASAYSAKYSSIQYDDLGRRELTTAPDSGTTSQTYNGFYTTITNALWQSQTTLRNSQNQIISVTDAANQTTLYGYDPFSNLTRTTDPAGNIFVSSYDLRGRMTATNDPDLGNWSYAYNALSERIRQVDAMGQTTILQYDQLGRMISRSEPTLNSSWTYDTALHGIGQIASASAANGYSRSYSYDTLGRPDTVSTIVDSATPYVTRTTYDSYSRVQTQTLPTGFAVTNVYNSDGYLSQVVNAATPSTVYWTANTLNAAGQLTQQTYGNNLITQQVFDPATGRLMTQTAGSGSSVQNMAYTYYLLGNLKTRTDTTQTLSESFGYDSLNRLRLATASSGAINTSTSYSYDAIGNVTYKSDVGTYSYNPSGRGSVRPHAVTSAGSNNYGYDANGNMTSGGGRTVTWTSFNMPDKITRGSQSTTFVYNAEHERVKEIEADGTVTIILNPRYDLAPHFEKKLLPNGSILYTSFLSAGSVQFAQLEETASTAAPSTITQSRLRYFHKDRLGSVIAITDESGTVLQRLSYDPSGKRRDPNGTADPNGLLTSTYTHHGYTGHEMLDGLGLIHMNGRIYDPLLYRMLSVDPTVQSPYQLQSYNRYTYAWNNPLAGTDPSGFTFEDDFNAFIQAEADPSYSFTIISYPSSSGNNFSWPSINAGGGVANTSPVVPLTTLSLTGATTLTNDASLAGNSAGLGTFLASEGYTLADYYSWQGMTPVDSRESPLSKSSTNTGQYLFNECAHGDGCGKQVVNGYVGAGGSASVGAIYFSADSGISFDTEGTICLTSSLCSGVGWNSIPSGSLGPLVGGGPGKLSSGVQQSEGGYVGSHQVTYSNGAVQYGRSSIPGLSVNVGGGVGYVSCRTTSICNNK